MYDSWTHNRASRDYATHTHIEPRAFTLGSVRVLFNWTNRIHLVRNECWIYAWVEPHFASKLKLTLERSIDFSPLNHERSLSHAHTHLPNLNWPAGIVADITESFESHTSQFTIIGLPSPPAHGVASHPLRCDNNIAHFPQNITLIYAKHTHNRTTNSVIVHTESLSFHAEPFRSGRVGRVQPVGRIIVIFLCAHYSIGYVCADKWDCMVRTERVVLLIRVAMNGRPSSASSNGQTISMATTRICIMSIVVRSLCGRSSIGIRIAHSLWQWTLCRACRTSPVDASPWSI